jgi:hypothetical protein
MLPTAYNTVMDHYRQNPALQRLRDEMGQVVADTVQQISQDTADRTEGEITVKKLTQGIFYSSTYYKLLQTLAPTKESVAKRLKLLIDSDAFFLSQPPAQFERLSRYCIRIRKEAVPAVALKALLENREFALMDCGMVCQLGQYNAIRLNLGDDKFNRLFSHQKGAKPLTISRYDHPDNPLLSLLQAMTPQKRESGRRLVAIGQRVCFDNMQDYSQKHLLLGEAGSYHLICSQSAEGQQKFVGHGLASSGMDEEEVEQLMLDEYNKLPMGPEAITDKLASEKLKVGKEGEIARIALLKEPSEANQLKFIQILKRYVPEPTAQAVAQTVIRQARPLTRPDISEETFGYREELYVIDFRIDRIQKWANTSLEKLSWNF